MLIGLFIFPFICKIVVHYDIFQIQEHGKQRSPDAYKWASEDELEETFGCPAAEMNSELSTGSAI